MGEYRLQTPVAFMIFNRPDTTARVFAEIARARPARLFVIADGPRAHHPEDVRLCEETRAILDQVDWDCEVLKNYSDHNLGCAQRVATGITWVFQQVEEAIILEDDCLPDPSFFLYCEELLDRYRYDEQVMHISGDNFQRNTSQSEYSYYFSRYPHVWGWASWRRAWQHYDIGIRAWRKTVNTSALSRTFSSRPESRFWEGVWDRLKAGAPSTWDYQWAFACIARNALSIVPAVNLVSNIGFGPDSTHTSCPSPAACISAKAMSFPLSHPDTIVANDTADKYTARVFFTCPPRAIQILQLASRYILTPLRSGIGRRAQRKSR